MTFVYLLNFTSPYLNPCHSGSARGLGLCSARLIAYLGATVYLADVDTVVLASAVETIKRDVPG